jgi:hypothetical protein
MILRYVGSSEVLPVRKVKYRSTYLFLTLPLDAEWQLRDPRALPPGPESPTTQ